MSRNISLVPCIWLDDQAEEAAAFYTRLLPDGEVLATSHYPRDGDNPAGRPPGSVLTVEIDVAGQRFTLLNGGPMFRPNHSVSFFILLQDKDAVDRVVKALLDGGSEAMPLDAYPWSERYAWVQDRYGVNWQVMYEPKGTGRTIMPCLMFTDEMAGHANEAITLYTKVFGGKVTEKAMYDAGEGPTDFVKHARFDLAGSVVAVMDSHIPHNVSFDEGVSLQVMCPDQEEVDRLWDALVKEGGTHGPCGWLKDRFGMNWQVVPEGWVEMVRTGDQKALDRAFHAILGMGKLDAERIEAAYRGA